MTHDDQVTNQEEVSPDYPVATDYQLYQGENSNENELTYYWEMDETLQMAKTYLISSDEESSDDNTSNDSLVPEPPSISGIKESTIYTSFSKTTRVDENYIMDDMSGLTEIDSNIKVSSAPSKHEFAKERVEREGNMHDKLYNACLKGQVSVIFDILQKHNAPLAPDEHGQTALYAACIGNHIDVITLLIGFGYNINHQDNEGKTPLHRTFESHDPDLAKTLITEFSASIEKRDTQNWTPVHMAIDQGYFDYSQNLNREFFHQDVDSKVNWIQLHAACFEGNAQDVTVLLEANTDVNHVNSAGYTPLHIAVAKNDIDLVTLLIDQNVDVNCVTSRRQTPLHVAAENGNDMIIQKLIVMNADPNVKDAIGNTSLHLSVQMKQWPKLHNTAANADTVNVPYQACSIQTIQTLINHGAEVNAVSSRCQSPLWLACCDGQNEFVKILLHAGSNANITDKNGDSSLHSAISGCCSRETIQEIIDHGAHVNAANDIGDTALLLAIGNAQAEIVRVLLTAKADPNIANADGDASLHAAAAVFCNEETLQEIIKYHADVNAVNKRGRTPLLLSCFGQTDSVKVLLKAGADPSISDEEGFSCLHAAVDGRCNKDTLQTLILHGAHTDAKRNDGTTALLSACRTGQSESVMFLLKEGADVNIINHDSSTCLHLAVQGHCSEETLLKILEQGVNVNALNNDGITALTLAYTSTQRESVKLLLENMADPNISDASGYSSLHAAAYRGCTKEILLEIITHKANLDSQDNDGRTALALACLRRQHDLVEVLLEAASNPNISDYFGFTSLHCAVEGGCR